MIRLDPKRRSLLVLGVVILVVLAGGGGYLLGKNGGSTAAPTPATPAPTTPTPTPTRSAASPSVSPTPESSTPLLPDGRYFMDPKKVVYQAADPFLRFDLATFLTGPAAADAATAHGDDSPPPNDYYIVNDNPLLRTIFVSPSVVVRRIPADACCTPTSSTFDAFSAFINGNPPSDYAKWSAWWWITIKGQVIVKITQQYLP